MLSIPFHTGEIFFAFAWIATRIGLAVRRQNFDLKRELLMLLMFVNLAFIFRFLFFPLMPVNGEIPPMQIDLAKMWPPRIDFSPLTQIFQIASTADLRSNNISNTALFVPTGIILPILYPKLNNLIKVGVVGANFALLIAAMQLPFGDPCSVNTIIQNTMGIGMGYGLFALAHSRNA